MARYKVSVKACDAESCGYRCQTLCPTGVFLAAPKKKLDDHGSRPDYRISPRFAYFCNGCMECVTCCPEKAVTVKGPQVATESFAEDRT